MTTVLPRQTAPRGVALLVPAMSVGVLHFFLLSHLAQSWVRNLGFGTNGGRPERAFLIIDLGMSVLLYCCYRLWERPRSTPVPRLLDEPAIDISEARRLDITLKMALFASVIALLLLTERQAGPVGEALMAPLGIGIGVTSWTVGALFVAAVPTWIWWLALKGRGTHYLNAGIQAGLTAALVISTMTLLLPLSLGVVLMPIWFVREAWHVWVVWHPWSTVVLATCAVHQAYEVISILRNRDSSLSRPYLRLIVRTWVYVFVLTVLTVMAQAAGNRVFASEAFRRSPTSTQLGLLAMPGVCLLILIGGLAPYAYKGQFVRAFVSFHHSREDVAIEVERALRRAGVMARRIPFRNDYEHDRLLQTIQKDIRRCDTLVCIPGAQPSFVENEVMVASTLRKFILFIVSDVDPRLPNTAYHGYPAFRLEELQRHDYAPLSHLVLLIAGNWKASLRHSYESWDSSFAEMKSVVVPSLVYMCGAYTSGAVYELATGGVNGFWTFLRTFHRTWFLIFAGDKDFLGLWAVANGFLLASVYALIGQFRARQIVKQAFLSGHLTRQLLQARLGGGRRALSIVTCLLERPPVVEHERSETPMT